MRLAHSQALHAKACKRIPGGVNSPVRAFGGVGGTPVFMKRGQGAYIIDADGNRYIDYVQSWGPLILGHTHPDVVRAICSAAELGSSFGCPTERETEIAQALCDAVPSLELVRLVNSGTEATMSAIRLARGFTGRPAIVKFEGCYHGHGDALLAKAGSGVATFGIPGTPGVPEGVVRDTLTLPFNDLAAVEALFAERAGDIAAVIVEPVAGNMGCVAPVDGYLEGLRAACTAAGALLIFDEVMTGFRVAWGGAQERFGVTPDLTTLGKVIGGGLPVGAYGGREDIMRRIAPDGPVYQAGTLSGNPIAVAAGLATLRGIRDEANLYGRLEGLGRRLVDGLIDAGKANGVPISGVALGAMFGFSFSPRPVRNYADAKATDTATFAKFFHGMLERGIYLAPSAFEAGFISAALSDELIDDTLQKAGQVLASLAA